MFKEYLKTLKMLVLKPGLFYEKVLAQPDQAGLNRFILLTGAVLSLELALKEIFASGRVSWMTLLVLLVLFGIFPTLIRLGVWAWVLFMRLCVRMIGENIPAAPIRWVVAYSSAGLIPLAWGSFAGPWFALSALLLQILGLEKALKCSRVTASIFTLFPFSVLVLIVLLVTLAFKVF